MKGYEVVSAYLLLEMDREVLEGLGFDMDRKQGRMCGLCPRDAACRGFTECDLGGGEVWVPEHVAAIMKIQTSNH